MRPAYCCCSHTEGEYDWTPAAEINTGPQPHTPDGDRLENGHR